MSSIEATISMLETMPEEARLKALEFAPKPFTSGHPINPYVDGIYQPMQDYENLFVAEL